MPHTPESLLQILTELGIAYTNHEHPAVFTVEEAQKHTFHLKGAHIKNLFLRDKKKNIYLVTAQDDTKVDLKKLGKYLEVKGNFSFGNAGLLMDVLGIEPGSVSPLALVNDHEKRVQKMVFDKTIFEHQLVNPHPLINTMTTTIKTADLKKFVAHLGYEIVLVDFEALSQQAAA